MGRLLGLAIVVGGIIVGLIACSGPTGTTAPNVAPQIVSFSADSEGVAAARFAWSVSDPDGDTLTCALDVDNDAIDDVSIGDCLTVASHLHSYGTPGLYEAKLSANDGHGHTVFATTHAIVNGTDATPPSWLRQFGSADTDTAAAAAATGGNVAVAGSTSGGLGGYANAGLDDVFIARFGALGTSLWVRQLGTSAIDNGYGVAADSVGNVLVTGRTYGALPGEVTLGGADAFLAKVDVQGNLLWVRQFGTSAADEGHGVAADGDGNVFVVGNTAGTLPGQFSAGLADVFVVKFDGQGNLLWARQFGSGNGDFANDVAVDADGNAFLAGATYAALPGQVSAGGADAFAAKVDAQGNVVWIRQFGSSDGDTGEGVAVGASGGVVIAGSTSGALPGQASAGGFDAFVAVYSAAGDALWRHQFGTASSDYGRTVALDAMGQVVVAGETDGAMDGHVNLGGLDGFVAKVDSGGNPVWLRQFGSSASEFLGGVTIDGGANVIAAGYTGGTLPGQTSLGGGDAYLVAYLP